jgi:hypothetical protein
MRGNTWLNEINTKYYSQRGEDGIIEAIFEVLKIEGGWVVEFGAWDGKYNSNTYHFLQHENFNGVLIEGDPDKCEQLQKQFASNKRIFPVKAFVSWKGEYSLDSILAKTPIPKEFELLSIDVDGTDYHIWEALTNYSAKLVVIEFNPTIPNEIDFVQAYDPKVNHGNSASALVRLAKSKGYQLIATTLNNAFFVKDVYFNAFQIQDNNLSTLRTKENRITYLFSGYDGTVFLRGENVLDLHNLPIREDKMQILPKYLRGYSSHKGLKKFLYKLYKSLYKRNII